jgi:DivIVA domain-containing protein
LINITSMDIAHKDFNRSLRGYNIEEVRGFLNEICESIENMFQERAQLLAENESLKRSIERFHSIETNMQSALMLAQRTTDDAIANANKQAELIIAEARSQGGIIEEEFARIKAQKRQFTIEFKVLLETYHASLDQVNHEKKSGGDPAAYDSGL